MEKLKKSLSEYKDLKKEAEQIKWLIGKTQKKIDKIQKEGAVSDVVSGGMGGKEHFKVTGFPWDELEETEELLIARINRLNKKEKEIKKKINEIECYIEEIDKSETRMIFRLKYLEKMSWVKVARKMNDTKNGRIYTEESCRSKHDRFLGKKK